MSSWFQWAFWLLLTAGVAWLWHSHGLRERALLAVRRHCTHQGLILLDDNVAFQKLSWGRDSRGQACLVRTYGFEFTVNGEQRYPGHITLVGAWVRSIQLAPHPFPVTEPTPSAAPLNPLSAVPPPVPMSKAQVIQLDEWRRQHPKASSSRPQKHT